MIQAQLILQSHPIILEINAFYGILENWKDARMVNK
jgi:hypothetical protein